MADYLRAYATRFALPVRTGVAVDRLSGSTGAFLAQTSQGTVRARHVVLAPGPFHLPEIPSAAAGLSPQVRQVHSSAYRSPEDVPPGDVLVVGGGNSAAQLAVELSATHRVTLAAPRQPWFLPTSLLGIDLYWWTRLTGVLDAAHDSRVARYVQRRGDAVVGLQLRDLARAGRIVVIPHRVVGAEGEQVRLADGTILPVGSVLWCTGFRLDTTWVDVPGAVAADGTPRHTAGASAVAGLHWMGLPWQTRLNSSIIDGVDRDGRAVARRIRADLGR
jgi:putative flavoprotein involved in K+ transport